MYQVQNGIANINGNNGKYDGKINDDSVRYGRNASDNFLSYLSDFKQPSVTFPDFSNASKLPEDKFQKLMDESASALKQLQERNAKIPPVKFNYQYSDKGLNVYSLLANSYEEMGKKTEISVKDLNKKSSDIDAEHNSDASVLDLNNDGKVDVAEYSTYTLAEDAMDKSTSVDASNIDGVITNDGMYRAMVIQMPDFKNKYQPILQGLYTKYNLGEAQDKFLKNENNLIG